MKSKIILVLDCGATNVRAIAIDQKGNIIAVHSLTNVTNPDPNYPEYRIWDVAEIWNKFKTCIGSITETLEKYEIAAVTVTAFGVDGAPFKKSGEMLYPVISWQCERTQPIMDNIGKYIQLDHLFKINGLQPFGFNTINKLIWLKENEPAIFEEMDQFLFIPSIFLYYLSGEMVNDTSMAGTSMMTDLTERRFSKEILSSVGIDKEQFLPLVEPGTVIGKVSNKVSDETGLSSGIPVVAAGHDTQFAVFGAGASENIPVLSSGTWEILMVRTKDVILNENLLTEGVTTELDPLPGFLNMGVQWIASGTIEWIKKIFFMDLLKENNVYDIMVDEALNVPAGSNGIRINPSLYPVPGCHQAGSISGINLNTGRGEIFRASLEALSFKTKSGLKILQKAGGFKAESLICVGGGTRNRLWNQIRADVLGIPVKVVEQKETTVLGAAMFAFSGIGSYKTAEEARSQIEYSGETFIPGEDTSLYQELADEYLDFLK